MKRAMPACFTFFPLAMICALSVVTLANGKPKMRRVTLTVLKRYPSSIQRNPDYGCCGAAGVGVNPYTALFLLDVSVSDDSGTTYAISCFEYHSWNHCRLPDADSYDAEITGNVVRITVQENGKKRRTYKVKYRIDHVSSLNQPGP